MKKWYKAILDAIDDDFVQYWFIPFIEGIFGILVCFIILWYLWSLALAI